MNDVNFKLLDLDLLVKNMKLKQLFKTDYPLGMLKISKDRVFLNRHFLL